MAGIFARWKSRTQLVAEGRTATAIGTAVMARYVSETEALKAELRAAEMTARTWKMAYDHERADNVSLADEVHEIRARLMRFVAPRRRDDKGHFTPLEVV
jgi:hypothetical protein